MAGPNKRKENLARLGIQEKNAANGQRTLTFRPVDHRPAMLTPNPRRVSDLWQEWFEGIGGSKPAKDFKDTERGRLENRDRFSQRKPIYHVLRNLVNAGLLPGEAIKRIEDQCPNMGLVQIGKRIRRAEKRGELHPSLCV